MDVKDTEEIKHAAGLCVIGTERHEARRIDNQLRGRSGRQGDPGYSKFFVCCDDELLMRFGSDLLRKAFASLKDEGLNNKFVTSAITSAQKKIEGQNFDTRKSLIDYDNVMKKQREEIYEQRDKILYSPSIYDAVKDYFIKTANNIVHQSVKVDGKDQWLDAELLKENLTGKYLPDGKFSTEGYQEAPLDEAAEDIGDSLIAYYEKKRNSWPEGVADQIEKTLTLRAIDKNWTSHIDSMSKLRDSIHLRSYAQTNPLQEYVREGYKMFDEMVSIISEEVTSTLLRVQLEIRKKEENSPTENQNANETENKNESNPSVSEK